MKPLLASLNWIFARWLDPPKKKQPLGQRRQWCLRPLSYVSSVKKQTFQISCLTFDKRNVQHQGGFLRATLWMLHIFGLCPLDRFLLTMDLAGHCEGGIIPTGLAMKTLAFDPLKTIVCLQKMPHSKSRRTHSPHFNSQFVSYKSCANKIFLLILSDRLKYHLSNHQR